MHSTTAFETHQRLRDSKPCISLSPLMFFFFSKLPETSIHFLSVSFHRQVRHILLSSTVAFSTSSSCYSFSSSYPWLYPKRFTAIHSFLSIYQALTHTTKHKRRLGHEHQPKRARKAGCEGLRTKRRWKRKRRSTRSRSIGCATEHSDNAISWPHLDYGIYKAMEKQDERAYKEIVFREALKICTFMRWLRSTRAQGPSTKRTLLPTRLLTLPLGEREKTTTWRLWEMAKSFTFVSTSSHPNNRFSLQARPRQRWDLRRWHPRRHHWIICQGVHGNERIGYEKYEIGRGCWRTGQRSWAKWTYSETMLTYMNYEEYVRGMKERRSIIRSCAKKERRFCRGEMYLWYG